MSLSDKQLLMDLASFSGLASAVGSLFIIGMVLVADHRHRKSGKRVTTGNYTRQLMWLAVADTIAGLSAVVELGQTAKDFPVVGSLCTAQAALMQFGYTSSILWQLCLAIELHVSLTYGTQGVLGTARDELRSRIYHLVCWGIPTITLTLAWVRGFLGPAGAWCWIGTKPGGEAETLGYRFFFYTLVLVILLTIVTLQIKTMSFIRQAHASAPSSSLTTGRSPHRTAMFRMLLFPLVYIVVWAPALASRVIEATGGKAPMWLGFVWSVVHAEGIWNAIVYSFTNKNFQRTVTSMCRCRPTIEWRTSSVLMTNPASQSSMSYSSRV